MRAATLSAEALSAQGRKAGLIGGKARAASMTPERRTEIARNAGKARAAKKKQRISQHAPNHVGGDGFGPWSVVVNECIQTLPEIAEQIGSFNTTVPSLASLIEQWSGLRQSIEQVVRLSTKFEILLNDLKKIVDHVGSAIQAEGLEVASRDITNEAEQALKQNPGE